MEKNRWKSLSVISIIQLILLLDATIVNVALPSIKQGLNFSDSSLTWVVSSYLITAGSLLLLGGKLGDVYGLKKVFISGMIIFAICSFLAATSQQSFQLIISRCGQGIGEALSSSTGLALISFMFPSGEERTKAFSCWSALGGIGSTLGVVLSGLIVEIFSWQMVFWINIPIIFIMLIFVIKYVPATNKNSNIRLDFKNAFLLTISIFMLVLGVVANGISNNLLIRILLIVVGIITITYIYKNCKNNQGKLIPSRLLMKSQRTLGYLLVSVLALSSGMLFYLGILLMRDQMGISVLNSGISWLPFCLGFFPGLFVFQYLNNKKGSIYAVFFGLSLATIGFLLFAISALNSSYFLLLIAMLVTSVGFGCVAPVSQYLSTIGLSEKDSGIGGGITTTLQQLFQVFGVSSFSSIAILTSNGKTITNKGFFIAFIVASILIFIILCIVVKKRKEISNQ